MFFRVKICGGEPVIAFIEIESSGIFNVMEYYGSAHFDLPEKTQRDLFASDMEGLIEPEKVEFIERVYVVSEACFMNFGDSIPKNLYCCYHSAHGYEDGSDYVTACLALHKAVRRGLVASKRKSRISLLLAGDMVDDIFFGKGFDFKAETRRKYMGSMIYSPPKNPEVNSQDAYFLAGFLGTVTAAKQKLAEFATTKEEALTLASGEEPKLKRKISKFVVPYPSPADHLKYIRTGSILRNVRVAEISKEDFAALQTRIGSLEKKNRDGIVQYRAEGPARVVFDPSASKLTLTFIVNKLF